jgi:hypothetical protein
MLPPRVGVKRHDIKTEKNVKVAVFWVVLCSLVEVYRRFKVLPCQTCSHISNRFLARGLLIALMVVAASTSETQLNFYQITRRSNPEDSHLYTRRRENLKSHWKESVPGEFEL